MEENDRASVVVPGVNNGPLCLLRLLIESVEFLEEGSLLLDEEVPDVQTVFL